MYYYYCYIISIIIIIIIIIISSSIKWECGSNMASSCHIHIRHKLVPASHKTMSPMIFDAQYKFNINCILLSTK